MSLLVIGLRQCRWPGRNQKIHRGNVTYFLDGGHTPDSLRVSSYEIMLVSINFFTYSHVLTGSKWQLLKRPS